MLFLKPKGRGNWKQLVLAIEGAHLPFLTVRAGDLVQLGGITFRICRVTA